MRCTYCGSVFHTLALCPKTWGGSVRRQHLRCTYCGGRDHSIAACPRTFHGNGARAWDEASVADHFVKD